MKKFIEVYDDIVPKKLVDDLEDYIITKSSCPLYYVSNISGIDNDKTYGFSYNILDAYNKNLKDERFIYRFLQPVYYLSSYLKSNLTEIIANRVFFQPPSTNPGMRRSGIHVDLVEPHYVCLYYVNDSDGDTVFFDDDKETEIKRVSPKKGRIAFFDGSIPHCTSLPADNLRVILNTDFRMEPFG